MHCQLTDEYNLVPEHSFVKPSYRPRGTKKRLSGESVSSSLQVFKKATEPQLANDVDRRNYHRTTFLSMHPAT